MQYVDLAQGGRLRNGENGPQSHSWRAFTPSSLAVGTPEHSYEGPNKSSSRYNSALLILQACT